MRQRAPPSTAAPAQSRTRHSAHRRSLKARYTWLRSSAIIYGLPSVLVLLVTIYLVAAPAPTPSAGTNDIDSVNESEKDGLPLIVHYQSLVDPLCPPALQVIQDIESHYTVLRCGDSIFAGQYSNINISIFTSVYVTAAAAIIDTHTRSEGDTSKQYLMIGINGGHVASIFNNNFGYRGDIVEQNPNLPIIDTQFFHWESRGALIHDRVDRYLSQYQWSNHSRQCQSQSESLYDMVIVNVIESQPRLTVQSVYTQELLLTLKHCLLAGEGVLVLTLQVSHDTKFYHIPLSVYQTLSTVFTHVDAYHDGSTDTGFLTFFASDRPLSFNMSLLPELPEMSSASENSDDPYLQQRYQQRYQQRVWGKMLEDWKFDSKKAATLSTTAPILVSDATLGQFVDWQMPVLKQHRINTKNLFTAIFKAPLHEAPDEAAQ